MINIDIQEKPVVKTYTVDELVDCKAYVLDDSTPDNIREDYKKAKCKVLVVNYYQDIIGWVHLLYWLTIQ